MVPVTPCYQNALYTVYLMSLLIQKFRMFFFPFFMDYVISALINAFLPPSQNNTICKTCFLIIYHASFVHIQWAQINYSTIPQCWYLVEKWDENVTMINQESTPQPQINLISTIFQRRYFNFKLCWFSFELWLGSWFWLIVITFSTHFSTKC